jgi:Family of unknown function (DUF5681)
MSNKGRKRVRIRADREDNEVGYGKPPRAHQFKPGQSGNPTGRTRGAKNEETILRELLQHKVGINERGKIRKITVLEAVFRRVAEDCLKGNLKSLAFLLNRYNAIPRGDPTQDGIGQDDKAVLEAYLREFKPAKDDGGVPT